MESGVIVAKLLERHSDHIALSDHSQIFLRDGLSVDHLDLGTSLTVSYTVRDGKKVAESIRRTGGTQAD